MLEPAQVGPRVLLGLAARLAPGDLGTALELLRRVARSAAGPALLFSAPAGGGRLRRRAAGCRPAAPRPWSAPGRRPTLPGEDVRSRVIALGVLAACLCAAATARRRSRRPGWR